jgi:Cellulase (glycosyl hydrolase family 5)
MKCPYRKSLRKILRLACTSSACVFLFFTQLAFAANFIQARGARLYKGGKEIQLRGTNLGNWLLQEDFMFGLYGTHTQMRSTMRTVLGAQKADAFWDEYERVYYTDKDAAFLQKRGFNALRVPVNENRIEDPNRPGHYDETALRRLDRVIAISKAHGIYVIVDLHAVMGGQSRQIYADSVSSYPDFWRYADFRRRATNLWVALAKRYKDEPGVAGYDLINEPNTEGHTELLTAWLRETYRAVRKVDPHHLIWLSGDDYGKGFEGLPDEFWSDPQAVFEFHIYPFFTFPIEKMTAYPQTVGGVRYDKAWLREKLRDKIAFGKKKPVWMGEFGFNFTEGKVPMLQAMVKDMISIANEEGWSWTEWTYKDQGQMGLVSPRPDTPWRTFLASPEINAEREKATPLFAVLGAGPETGDMIVKMTNQIASHADHATRQEFELAIERVFDEELDTAIVFHLKSKSESELRAMADSFAFDSCEPNPDLAAVFP